MFLLGPKIDKFEYIWNWLEPSNESLEKHEAAFWFISDVGPMCYRGLKSREHLAKYCTFYIICATLWDRYAHTMIQQIKSK